MLLLNQHREEKKIIRIKGKKSCKRRIRVKEVRKPVKKSRYREKKSRCRRAVLSSSDERLGQQRVLEKQMSLRKRPPKQFLKGAKNSKNTIHPESHQGRGGGQPSSDGGCIISTISTDSDSQR